MTDDERKRQLFLSTHSLLIGSRSPTDGRLEIGHAREVNRVACRTTPDMSLVFISIKLRRGVASKF